MRFLKDWWCGVRRLDWIIVRRGGSFDMAIWIRWGPFGLRTLGQYIKHNRPWDCLGAEFQELLVELSRDTTTRVPEIRLLFGVEVNV